MTTSTPIDELEVPMRVTNLLIETGFNTTGDLCGCTLDVLTKRLQPGVQDWYKNGFKGYSEGETVEQTLKETISVIEDALAQEGLKLKN